MPAAYYADLACERGRCYLNDFLVDDKASSAGGSSKRDRKAEDLKVFMAAKQTWGEGVSVLSELDLSCCAHVLIFFSFQQLHPDMRGTMFYI